MKKYAVSRQPDELRFNVEIVLEGQCRSCDKTGTVSSIIERDTNGEASKVDTLVDTNDRGVFIYTWCFKCSDNLGWSIIKTFNTLKEANEFRKVKEIMVNL